MNARNLAELYGMPLVDWQQVEARLDCGLEQVPPNGNPCWLATTNADGSPHVTGVGALWVSGAFYFQTGVTTRKGRNLARDPRCSMTAATDEFHLVVDGDAALLDDPAVVADLATRWVADGWPVRVDDTGIALTAEYSAPSAGPPPWRAYRLTPRQATVVLAAEPGGATRWRFGAVGCRGCRRNAVDRVGHAGGVRLTFCRMADRRPVETVVERDDGVVFAMRGAGGGAGLPHDLVHAVVETELRIVDGIWGCVADGVMWGSMRHVSGRRPPHAQARSNRLKRERSAAVQRAEAVADLVGRMARGAEVLGTEVAASGVPAGELGSAAAAVRAAEQRWAALAPGATLTVEWAVRSGTTAGRRRR